MKSYKQGSLILRVLITWAMTDEDGNVVDGSPDSFESPDEAQINLDAYAQEHGLEEVEE
jgi:hypothetical protein